MDSINKYTSGIGSHNSGDGSSRAFVIDRSSLRWLRAFHVSVGSCGVGRGFGLCRLLGGAEMSGAVVAAIFDVVVLGQWRDHGGASGDLADAVQDDFRRGRRRV